MKYILVNKTKISNKTLHKIIQFTCPKNLSNFKVNVKHFQSTLHGEAFRKSVYIGINKKIKLPRVFDEKSLQKYGYYNNSIVKNLKEVLISLISHELRHLWQKTVSKQDFDNELVQSYLCPVNNEIYNIGYKSEKDASLYSRKMVLKWRKYIKNGN